MNNYATVHAKSSMSPGWPIFWSQSPSCQLMNYAKLWFGILVISKQTLVEVGHHEFRHSSTKFIRT